MKSEFTTTWLSGEPTPRISTVSTDPDRALLSLALQQPDIIIRGVEPLIVTAHVLLRSQQQRGSFEILWHEGKVFNAADDSDKLPEISFAEAVELSGACIPWKNISEICPRGSTLESVHFSPAPKDPSSMLVIVDMLHVADPNGDHGGNFLLGLNGLPTLVAIALGDTVVA